ncbi:MAG TPA: zinc ribbon domain-containing protein [bacterium]|nr:zinc ribbon domain-containing protein [bacterium]
MSEETYTIPYHCSNCGNEQTEVITKGIQHPDLTTCNNCGCYTSTRRITIKSKLEPQDYNL